MSLISSMKERNPSLIFKSEKGGYLRFDFYFEINGRGFAVEFDGIQHRKAVDIFGGEEALIEGQLRDSMKDKYAKEKNITLIRIAQDKPDYTSAKKLILNIIKDAKEDKFE